MNGDGSDAQETVADDAAIDARGDRPPEHVGFGEAVRIWCQVAALSFGGPAGQIAVMHRILVERKRWISEERFLHALNYCMLLPGPEAQQLATYIGWLLHGLRGGLTAGLLFITPGVICILLLSIAYVTWADTPFIPALFFGLKAAVTAIVVEAVLRIGRRALKNRLLVLLAAASFIGIFFFDVPFPWIVGGAALVGFVGGRIRPELFAAAGHKSSGHASDDHGGVRPADRRVIDARPAFGRSLATIGVWLAVWFGPVLAIRSIVGPDHVFVTEAWFFSHTAVITFGGAYAVLAYIGQEAVATYHWLSAGEMLDGLGMAETTPGPLIMVVQFVGFLGAYRSPGSLDPLTAGIIGSLVTTWVTFAPCFLWIFLGAPYIEYLRRIRGLGHALSGITAAVVGVILNLAVWFALHVVFGEVAERRSGPLRWYMPDGSTFDGAAALIAVASGIAILRFKRSMFEVLAAAAAVGTVWHLVFRTV
jgi:chromate transporter